jgi:hypothetical protein
MGGLAEFQTFSVGEEEAELAPLAHRAEKWTRISASNDALLLEGEHRMDPKSGSTFGSDALVAEGWVSTVRTDDRDHQCRVPHVQDQILAF